VTRHEIGDQIEYYDEDMGGNPVWRPGVVTGIRYEIHAPGGGMHSVPAGDVRSAPRLPLEGIE
jgi:hypothetical protein